MTPLQSVLLTLLPRRGLAGQAAVARRLARWIADEPALRDLAAGFRLFFGQQPPYVGVVLYATGTRTPALVTHLRKAQSQLIAIPGTLEVHAPYRPPRVEEDPEILRPVLPLHTALLRAVARGRGSDHPFRHPEAWALSIAGAFFAGAELMPSTRKAIAQAWFDFLMPTLTEEESAELRLAAAEEAAAAAAEGSTLATRLLKGEVAPSDPPGLVSLCHHAREVGRVAVSAGLLPNPDKCSGLWRDLPHRLYTALGTHKLALAREMVLAALVHTGKPFGHRKLATSSAPPRAAAQVARQWDRSLFPGEQRGWSRLDPVTRETLHRVGWVDETLGRPQLRFRVLRIGSRPVAVPPDESTLQENAWVDSLLPTSVSGAVLLWNWLSAGIFEALDRWRCPSVDIVANRKSVAQLWKVNLYLCPRRGGRLRSQPKDTGYAFAMADCRTAFGRQDPLGDLCQCLLPSGIALAVFLGAPLDQATELSRLERLTKTGRSVVCLRSVDHAIEVVVVGPVNGTKGRVSVHDVNSAKTARRVVSRLTEQSKGGT